MSTGPTSLEEIQRTMAAAVMHPLTADENMQTTAANGRSMEAVAASFVAPNSKLSAFERLEIYNRQYWYRVLGALAEDFPGLRVVLGAEAFDALSIAYLQEHPSRSFTLRNLGSKMAEWLAANPKFTGRRHRLAVDVARMEWAFVEAFDSAEWSPLTLEQIAILDAGSKLALQPHLQLIALEYPADALVVNLHKREKRQTSEAGVGHAEAQEPKAKLPGLRRKPTWLAAHRVDYSVYYLRLEREEFLTLRAIREGIPLVDALATAFIGSRVADARRPKRIQQWFGKWAELGWICAPDLETLVKE